MASRPKHSLSAREQAMVRGGGAATLPVGEWHTLLSQVVSDHQSNKRSGARVSWLYKFGGGAALISALGHLAPAPFSASFRVTLIGSVALCIVGLLLALRFRTSAIANRFERLELPLVNAFSRLNPEGHLYLAFSNESDKKAFSSALFAFNDNRALLFSLSPQGLKKTQLEVGLVATRAIDSQDPSVSGITRQAAALAQAEGNPFSSLEMVALREAHELQARWAKLERFSNQENAMPQIEEVLAEDVVTLSKAKEEVRASDVMNALKSLGKRCEIPIF